jgi:hypothetical protein
VPTVIFRDDIEYSDLGNAIEVELKLIGAWIYIETPLERFSINDTSLRYDGTPRNILEYVINQHPNEVVTIIDLIDANLSTSRDLRQIAIKAGLKGYVRDLFMPVCTKDKIKVINKITLRPGEIEAIDYLD